MDGQLQDAATIAVGREYAGGRTRTARGRLVAGGVIGLAILLGAVWLGVACWGQGRPAAAQMTAPPPPPVTVSQPLQRKLADWTIFTGQFSAVDRVEIRAQVSGYLTEIHFTDGQLVHQGDLLFVIDPRPFEIQLQQATAQFQTATAALDLANQELARATELKRRNFGSGETVDQRVQVQRAALAAVEQAKAAIRAAQLNLVFSRITAPLSGRISAHRISIGNLVTGGQTGGASTLLTTIVSLDPIHLDFDMSEGDYLTYQRFLQSSGQGAGDIDRTVEASLSDETGWGRHGALDFIDNEIDRSSGTIHARASLPNPDLFIAPGQFARLRVPTSAVRTVLLVPDAALVTDQSRKLVMTVAPDGTVVPKVVELGPVAEGLRVIRAGLAPTDQVVINGLVRVRPGAKVTPQTGLIAAAAPG